MSVRGGCQPACSAAAASTAGGAADKAKDASDEAAGSDEGHLGRYRDRRGGTRSGVRVRGGCSFCAGRDWYPVRGGGTGARGTRAVDAPQNSNWKWPDASSPRFGVSQTIALA